MAPEALRSTSAVPGEGRLLSGILQVDSLRRSDLLALIAAMLVAVFAPVVRSHSASFAHGVVLRVSVLNGVLAVLCVSLWWLVITASSFGSAWRQLSVLMMLGRVTIRVVLGSLIAAAVLWTAHPKHDSLRAAGLFLCTAAVLFVFSRIVRVLYDAFVRPRIRRARQVIIVGSGARALDIAEHLRFHPQWRYRLLGFVDSAPQNAQLPMLGGISDLETILMGRQVDEVFITLPVKSRYDDIQTAIRTCERLGVQSGYSMDLFEMRGTKRRSVDQHDASAVVLHMVHDDARHIFKRVVDIAGALVGLVLFGPLMLATAIAIRLTSPGPVIFRQQRYGLNRSQFTMYKFRTMVVDADQRQAELEHLNETAGPTFKIRKDPRITPIGRFLRQTSIDELPQLLNVLKGDMSLVGPRPLPMRDVSKFAEGWLMRRFSVKPGLTGLWQVSGRSNANFANWMRLDLEYIDYWTFLLDLKILARTFPAVIRRDGAA